MFLPAHVISRAGYTQFVRGLIGSEACRVGSRGGRLPAFLSGFHCVCFAPGGKTLFEEGVFISVPCGTCPASAEVERWLCSWESQMDQIEGMKMGETLSSSFPFRSSLLSCLSCCLACCRGNACITVILSSLYESFTSDRVYLSGCLTAFNFEELIMHFI